MTLRQQRYQEFLSSDFWKQIRLDCFKRDGEKCRYCASTKNLQAHHVLYPDDWYQTELYHLITLCRSCHEKEHGIKKRKQKRWKPRPKFVSIEGVKTMSELLGARSKRLITRQQFKEAKNKLFPPTPKKPKPPKKKKEVLWWIGMYEGKPRPF